MRSLLVVLAATFALLTPTWSALPQPLRRAAAAQALAPAGGKSATVTTERATRDQEKPAAAKPRVEPEPPGRWVRTLTNVQVELTITDQTGAGAPEKKTVSMVASSGSWGRIRSAQMVREAVATRSSISTWMPGPWSRLTAPSNSN